MRFHCPGSLGESLLLLLMLLLIFLFVSVLIDCGGELAKATPDSGTPHGAMLPSGKNPSHRLVMMNIKLYIGSMDLSIM